MQNQTQINSIHQLVELQVLKTPDAVAVVFENQQLTYRELNERANQLAHYLQALGVKPEVLVGICVDRSLEMIVGLLGILKAGGAYLPLDMSYPIDRLRYMLEDAQALILLTQSHLSDRLPKCNSHVVYLDSDWQAIAQYTRANPQSKLTLDNLAYVLYTSGSTGRTKGVAMPQHPLVNLLTWQIQNFRYPVARTLQFTPVSFDVSFQEIFSTLSSGGTLVLVSESIRRNAEALLHYLSAQAIERLFLPYIALQHLAEVAKTKLNLPIYLREIITAGEQLKITNSIAHWFSHLKECTLENQYGPSESHVVTAYRLSGSSKNWLHLPPIGQPIANTHIYLLEPNLRRKEDPCQLVATGEIGELAIGGVALARGYLNQPELTDNKFIPNPFSNETEARLYRTGDLARYRPDGTLEYIERIDAQVKIRGIRIELGEIEVILSQHPLVKDVVVVAREDSSDNKRLVAYIVIEDARLTRDKDEIAVHLRTFVQEQLPNCMVPSAFMFLDTLPLTPSGKVDRRALPTPSQSRPALKEDLVLPRTQIEKSLSEIWSQVLSIQPVGVYDNFFDLGGNSLLAIQVIFKAREVFQIEIPIVALFDTQAIATLAEFINAAISSKTAATSDDSTIADLEADAALVPTINLDHLSTAIKTEPDNIFITGVTGFLGAFLLYELLEQTQANIYCLVQATDPEIGKQKIQSNLEKYLLWDKKNNSRIIPITGDLSEPLLGVSEEQFLALARKIDVIYHNAAYINLIYPYTALRATNVFGTQELLKLATQIKVKPFHFISTLDVFQTSRAFGTNLITEQDELNPSEAIRFDGYTKSKWVSEKMVTTAQLRGLPVSIYRPAMITGHSKTGVANVNDLMNRLIKGFVQLGYAPSFDMMFNIAPVDYFSKGAIYISRQEESLGKTFNFINPQPVSMTQFVETINTCGYSVQQVCHKQWEDLLRNNIESLDSIVSVLTSKTSEKGLSYLEKCSVGANLTSYKNVINGLKGTTIVCSPINAQLLSTYLFYYIRSGFLKMPEICNGKQPVMSLSM
jgi:amino acid adenylation domain-containing protein/thioester reductase-like protein